VNHLRRLALLAASVYAFAALAIEPPQPAAGAPAKPTAQAETESAPAEESAAAEETAPAGETAPTEEQLPPLPPDAAPAGPSPERFNPTEKVRADFPVSFPIDI
jgi:hypothetical protein